ncbi:MAG: hypothetical protein WB791_02260 [Waddliaceae bacterium]
MVYYNQQKRQQLQEKWTAWIEEWQSSGLSGAAWCKQQKIAYHQFIYWKKRLSNETDQILTPRSFIELDDHPESSGIEIVLDQVFLRLSRDFDSSTLLRCLRTLKEAKC